MSCHDCLYAGLLNVKKSNQNHTNKTLPSNQKEPEKTKNNPKNGHGKRRTTNKPNHAQRSQIRQRRNPKRKK